MDPCQCTGPKWDPSGPKVSGPGPSGTQVGPKWTQSKWAGPLKTHFLYGLGIKWYVRSLIWGGWHLQNRSRMSKVCYEGRFSCIFLRHSCWIASRIAMLFRLWMRRPGREARALFGSSSLPQPTAAGAFTSFPTGTPSCRRAAVSQRLHFPLPASHSHPPASHSTTYSGRCCYDQAGVKHPPILVLDINREI